AHHVVADLVREMIQNGRRPDQTRPADLDAAAIRVLGEPLGLSAGDITSALDARGFVETRTSAGGIAPAEVARLLARSSDLATSWRTRVGTEKEKRDAA